MFSQIARNERFSKGIFQEPHSPFSIAGRVHTFWTAYSVTGKELFVTVVARDVVARVAPDRSSALLGEDVAAYDTFTIGCG
ncbi:MAG: hypothetical protein EBY29_12330 [Planctomycetes bacterium]|nr:hypothetical protein [Planctomycetota bacterium]